MSKRVFVLLREVEGDRFHQGFAEFEGVYKTLEAAKCEWAAADLTWVEGEAGYGGQSRWTAKLAKLGMKGIILVIEDYEVISQ